MLMKGFRYLGWVPLDWSYSSMGLDGKKDIHPVKSAWTICIQSLKFRPTPSQEE